MTKNRGETIILILNLILYVSVLLFIHVIDPLLPSEPPISHPGSGFFFFDIIINVSTFYFMIAIVGSFYLYKGIRDKWVYNLAMIGWAFEAGTFLLIVVGSFQTLFFREPVIISRPLIWLLISLSIVILKFPAMVYYNTKKVRNTYNFE